MTDFAAIVAAAAGSRGIGFNGKLPWRIPGDMGHFKRITIEPPSPEKMNAVIMGRKTWESIPSKFRPLSGRTNVVLTKQAGLNVPNEVLVASSLSDATSQLQKKDNLGHVFVIGGSQVYDEAIHSGLVNRIIYTEVSNLDESTKFDVFFPKLEESEWQCHPFDSDSKENEPSSNAADSSINVDEESGLCYRFLEYNRLKIAEGAGVNPEEMQYLEMCRDIIENGVKRNDRTGTGTLSKFGTQMRFSLRDGTIPLLTTKRVFWRGVAEELLWFISGNTNGNELAAKGVHIWDGNGSREFLDSRGLHHREVGDLGPVYGFQWRHFGAKYVDMHTDYTGKGIDQLAECIHKIKNKPEDRRIIMSAWNPSDLNEMALPPCHMFCQFYVDTVKGELSCLMYQRSADMGLGVPFNIASYALLTHLVAHVCGLKPGDFVHSIGDAHVYLNHVDALREQNKRLPRKFPKLKINPEKQSIDDFELGDLDLIGYKPHKTIKMKMSV